MDKNKCLTADEARKISESGSNLRKRIQDKKKVSYELGKYTEISRIGKLIFKACKKYRNTITWSVSSRYAYDWESLKMFREHFESLGYEVKIDSGIHQSSGGFLIPDTEIIISW